MVCRATLFNFVCGFVCFSLFESEGVSERAGDPLPEGSDPFRDRDEVYTKKDNERRGKNASPQLSDEWVPEVEEAGTHHLGYLASTTSWEVSVKESWMLRVTAERRQINEPKNPAMISHLSVGLQAVFTCTPHSHNKSLSSTRLHPIKRLSGEVCNNTIQLFNVALGLRGGSLAFCRCTVV